MCFQLEITPVPQVSVGVWTLCGKPWVRRCNRPGLSGSWKFLCVNMFSNCVEVTVYTWCISYHDVLIFPFKGNIISLYYPCDSGFSTGNIAKDRIYQIVNHLAFRKLLLINIMDCGNRSKVEVKPGLFWETENTLLFINTINVELNFSLKLLYRALS